MNERIHRYLDGEISFDDLSPDDQREAEEYGVAIGEAVTAFREEPAPDLTSTIMGRIAREEAAIASSGAVGPAAHRRAENRAHAGWLAWLWQPRPIRVRPAYALAMAAALAGVILVPGPRAQPDGAMPPAAAGPAVADAAERTTVYVQFRLDAPDASSVRLAGTFTGWEPAYTLHETAPGVWSILVPLTPGVHDYSFVIDGGEWVPDPAAPQVEDGFGGENSRVAILLPEGRV
jgi:hypothetical protein